MYDLCLDIVYWFELRCLAVKIAVPKQMSLLGNESASGYRYQNRFVTICTRISVAMIGKFHSRTAFTYFAALTLVDG